MTWGRLDTLNYYGEYRTDHVRLLSELYAIYRSNANLAAYYLYGSDRSVELTGFESRQLWSLLDEAASIGLSIVYPRKLGVVPSLRLRGVLPGGLRPGTSTGSLVITPTVRIDDTGGPVRPLCFVGTDGHGLAYTGADDPHRFRLARLASPVPPALQRMTLAGKRLEIPAEARARFAGEYYLQLRQAATVTCTDGSFTAAGDLGSCARAERPLRRRATRPRSAGTGRIRWATAG